MRKPPACGACPLGSKTQYQRFMPGEEWRGEAYALPDGPEDSSVAFIGEALGKDEAEAALRDTQWRNFVGRVGGILNKGLDRLGHPRNEQRVSNVVRCMPPRDWLVGAPWEKQAISACAPNLDQVLWEQKHRVFVTLGVTATREVLKRWHIDYKGKMENWHGYPIGPPEGPWVIPTFHPSFILHDKWGHTYVLYRDIDLAYRVAEQGWQEDEPSLVVDPSPEWFERWAQAWNPEAWLSVDVETRDKLAGQDEDEIEEGQSLEIVRINFSYNGDEGVTVPWEPQYLRTITWLLSHSDRVYCLWNDRFDQRCLNAVGTPIKGLVLDLMSGWHCLQSDVRKSLGFVAPYFSKAGPWKHLSDTQPGEYAAKDAAQTQRIAYGLIPLLKKGGQYDYAFRRHVVDLDRLVLRPAERRGPRMDREFLEEFSQELTGKLEQTVGEAQALVPEEALLVSGDRTRANSAAHPDEFAMEVQREVQICLTCGLYPVAMSHVCRDEVTQKKLEGVKAQVALQLLPVTRYFDREPFRLGSSTHMLNFIEKMKIALPKTGGSKKKKTDRPTLDDKVLDILAKRKGPWSRLFALKQDYTKIEKVKSTYVDGARGREKTPEKEGMPCRLFKEVGLDGQIYEVLRGHEFVHTASTQRLGCQVYPLQGVKADKDEGYNPIAAGFRKAIVPRPGHRLVSLDYSGIETLLTGWFCRDPEYIKWGRRDLYSYLVSHKIGKPADPRWEESHIRGYLAEVKKEHKGLRDVYKTVALGTGYGRTVFGMQKGNPKTFPTIASAQQAQDFYFTVAPKLREWQASMRNFAARNNYLGGPVGGEGAPNQHPFGYIHWFWAVMEWDAKRRMMRPEGPDSNRVVSLFPQGTAFGVLAEACLEMVDPESESYIGDACGDPRTTTPFLALIHDEALLELPEDNWEEMAGRAQQAMLKPIEELPCPPEWNEGTHLKIGVEVKMSKTTWKEMEVVHL